MPRILNYTPDIPDERDFKYTPFKLEIKLPKSVDLHSFLPPAYDQGDLGSCTANATSSAICLRRIKQGKSFINPSRLFIYYKTREIAGSISSDSGASIRQVIKSVAKYGYPSENLWPYLISKFAEKPSDEAHKEAMLHLVTKYESISNNLDHIKSCLAEGYPVSLGVMVYESFETPIEGVIRMPKKREAFLGGHAIILIGYDDKTKLFKFRNSWGSNWGDNGNGYLPYKYIQDRNLAMDFWRIMITE